MAGAAQQAAGGATIAARARTGDPARAGDAIATPRSDGPPPDAHPSPRDARPGLSSEVAVLALADLEPSSRPWGWSRFVLGRRDARRAAGLRFVKVLGSGAGGGFGASGASPSIQGLFCAFDDEACADAFLAESGPFDAWRRRAREHFSVKLRAWSSRGSWSGKRFEIGAEPPPDGPVASLTRGSIRPSRARRFWRVQPAAERAFDAARGCLLWSGIGEAPLLRQATFSVWESVAAMDAYARTGAHLAAVRAAAQDGFFSESAFVRFVPYDARGSWQGRRLDA